MALRQPLHFYGGLAPLSSKEVGNSSVLVKVGERRTKGGILSAVFCDGGHVDYYNSALGSSGRRRRMIVHCGTEVKTGNDKPLKKKTKQQLKLVKGLSKDLSSFSQMGFGLDSDGSLLNQIKGNIITEATQVLLEQLERLKAQEKELKRLKKEEKRRSKAAAARMKNHGHLKMSSISSSSSSSSSSSDSECGDVVDMRRLHASQQVIEEESGANPSMQNDVCKAEEVVLQPNSNGDDENMSACSKKIEVCMGGKCKRAGAGVLEELKRVVGIENVVSGCKCMGRCRDGPNVKIVDNEDNKSVCNHVGLEDVNAIVSTFLDDQHPGFAA